MKDREKRCSECLELQDKEMESPYVCGGCEDNINVKKALAFIEDWYGEKMPKDWNIEYTPLEGFTVGSLINIMNSYLEYNKELQNETRD